MIDVIRMALKSEEPSTVLARPWRILDAS